MGVSHKDGIRAEPAEKAIKNHKNEFTYGKGVLEQRPRFPLDLGRVVVGRVPGAEVDHADLVFLVHEEVAVALAAALGELRRGAPIG